MRADAQRRREAILRSARRLFAAQGGGVPLETIADDAGVGIATLYRNFESRDALADAVALAILDDVTAAAEIARDRMPGGADAAWRDFVETLVSLDLGALTDALRTLLPEDLPPPMRAAQREALTDVAEVMAAAREAGVVRAAFEPLELVLAVGLLTRPPSAAVRAVAPDLVPRLVEVLLSGLRG